MAFVLVVLGVIGGALATIQWYGTSTYFVSFAGSELVIYQGRPGGVLWVDPTIEERTGIERSQVPERYLQAILAGNEQPSLTKARQYVDNIERDIAEAEPTPAVTTTTTSPTTTQVN
jgi:protein phosphatase